MQSNKKQSMSHKIFWRRASGMEAFKLGFYLAVPILAGFVYANPKVMSDLIMRLKLIQYPPSAPAPPVGEEINEYRIKPEKK